MDAMGGRSLVFPHKAMRALWGSDNSQVAGDFAGGYDGADRSIWKLRRCGVHIQSVRRVILLVMVEVLPRAGQ